MRYPKNIYLKPLYEYVCREIDLFTHISFHHIYREGNTQANQLYKLGLQYDEGSMAVLEVNNESIKELDLGPIIF